MPRKPRPPAPLPAPTPIPTTTMRLATIPAWLGATDRDKALGWAVDLGLTHVRVCDWLDTSAQYHAPSLTDAGSWAKVDGFFAAALSRGLKVLLDLSTCRNWIDLYAGGDPYGYDWQWIATKAATYPAAMVSIAGEPEPSDGPFAAFYARVGAQLKAAGVTCPISNGGMLHYASLDWQAIFQAVDVPSVHVYSATDEGLLPALAAYAKSLGKPLLVEEFGFLSVMSDWARAESYRRVYVLSKSVGAMGAGFWMLGPGTGWEVNPSTPLTYAEAKKGMA